jgi:hypothetical protein
MLQKEHGSGSTSHDKRFQEWTLLSKKYLKNYGLDYYKFIIIILEAFYGNG